MIYNVRIAVVDLVEAESPEEAIAKLRTRLTWYNFTPYTDDPVHRPDAFESEPLT